MKINLFPLFPEKTSFKSRAIAMCKVRKEGSSDKKNAIVYEMDPRNLEDVDKIRESFETRAIKNSFLLDALYSNEDRKYYILEECKGKDIIACAMTSRHYSPKDGKMRGSYTLIDEMDVNRSYNDPVTPTLACIIEDAKTRKDRNVVTGVEDNFNPKLNKFRYHKGSWILGQKSFSDILNRAENRSNITFLENVL